MRHGFLDSIFLRAARGVRSFLALTSLVLLAGCDQPLEAVVLKVHHRVFVGFQETHRVAPGEMFSVGDTDYSARVVGFVPDFLFDNRTMKVVSGSNEMRNPAIRLEVFENGKKVEELWAFTGEGPPHFGRASMLAFQIEEFVWKPGQEPPKPAESDSTGTAPADTSAAEKDERPTAPADSADPSGKQ